MDTEITNGAEGKRGKKKSRTVVLDYCEARKRGSGFGEVLRVGRLSFRSQGKGIK